MTNGLGKQLQPKMGVETKDEDLGCPPGMRPRPGEVQTEAEGTLEWVAEEGGEYLLWPETAALGRAVVYLTNLPLVRFPWAPQNHGRTEPG